MCNHHLLFQFLLHNLVRMFFSPVMLFMFFLIIILIFMMLTFKLLLERENTIVVFTLYLILSLILIYHLSIIILFHQWTHTHFRSLWHKPFLFRVERCHARENDDSRVESDMRHCFSFYKEASVWLSIDVLCKDESRWVIGSVEGTISSQKIVLGLWCWPPWHVLTCSQDGFTLETYLVGCNTSLAYTSVIY